MLLSFCEGNHQWPVGLPHKGNSNVKNVSIWWFHNDAGQHVPISCHNYMVCLPWIFFSPSVPEVKGIVNSALYNLPLDYSDVKMSVMVSKITSISIVHSTICLGANQRNHQSSTTLAFVRGIRQWPVNPLHKGPVMRKMFPFDYVIIIWLSWCQFSYWCKTKGLFQSEDAVIPI